MPTQQGDLALLDDPIAQQLLYSAQMAQLAYTWTDGSPRVVPIWFHWDGQQIVLGTPADAPKVAVLRASPRVALSIEDGRSWPYKALLIRGTAEVQIHDGMVPEYLAAARRYLGSEQGEGWVAQAQQLVPQMARIAITPEWVGILDFEQRFPSALEKAMATAQTA